jgi:hypothetical protein
VPSSEDLINMNGNLFRNDLEAHRIMFFGKYIMLFADKSNNRVRCYVELIVARSVKFRKGRRKSDKKKKYLV